MNDMPDVNHTSARLHKIRKRPVLEANRVNSRMCLDAQVRKLIQ
jgi:hypothetical protein